LVTNPPKPSSDDELSPEEIECRAGEIAHRLLNTPPVKRSPEKPNSITKRSDHLGKSD
jgi:hypothetical protein